MLTLETVLRRVATFSCYYKRVICRAIDLEVNYWGPTLISGLLLMGCFWLTIPAFAGYFDWPAALAEARPIWHGVLALLASIVVLFTLFLIVAPVSIDSENQKSIGDLSTELSKHKAELSLGVRAAINGLRVDAQRLLRGFEHLAILGAIDDSSVNDALNELTRIHSRREEELADYPNALAELGNVLNRDNLHPVEAGANPLVQAIEHTICALDELLGSRHASKSGN